MTPKEKADYLLQQFYNNVIDGNLIDYSDRKIRIFKIKTINCALIAVEQILNALPPNSYGLEFELKREFWNNVKQEIEKS